MTQHEPTPEFLDALEARLAFEARRHEMFAEPDPPRRIRLHGGVLVLVILFSATLGAGGVVAAERIQSAARRELLEMRAQIQLETTARRRAFLEEHVALVTARVDQGVSPPHERQVATQELDSCLRDIRKLELDLREVRSTGAEPRDELSAPPVDGVDFVGERLIGEIDHARRALATHEMLVERTQALYEHGLIPVGELHFVGMSQDSSVAEIEQLEERRRLRQRYLAGEIPGSVVDLLGYRSEAQGRFDATSRLLEQAHGALESTQARYNAGVISSLELSEIQKEVLGIESEIKLAEIEIRLIEDELPEEWRDR